MADDTDENGQLKTESLLFIDVKKRVYSKISVDKLTHSSLSLRVLVKKALKVMLK